MIEYDLDEDKLKSIKDEYEGYTTWISKNAYQKARLLMKLIEIYEEAKRVNFQPCTKRET